MKRLHRHGTTVLEATIALGLFAAVIGSLMPLVVYTRQGRPAAKWQLAAMLEAHNLAERIAALPEAEVTDEHLASLEMTSPAAQRLPGGELHITLSPGTEETANCRSDLVEIAISWRSRRGTSRHTMRIFTWAHRTAAPEGSRIDDSSGETSLPDTEIVQLMNSEAEDVE